MSFLAPIISKDGLLVDPRKDRVVQDWKQSTNVREIKNFLRLAGYYK